MYVEIEFPRQIVQVAKMFLLYFRGVPYSRAIQIIVDVTRGEEMKKYLSGIFVLSAVMASGIALAEEISPHTVTSNVGFISDYTFRGISQNFRNPALQGGFDYAHSSGLFAGTWASNISSNQYTNSSMEWDMYGGYNGKVNDDLGYSLGLNYAYYPGGKTQPTQSNTKNWDTVEANAGFTFSGFNLKYTYALTDWYGISSQMGGGYEPVMIINDVATTTSSSDNSRANLSSQGSNYIEANYNYVFLGNHTLLLHAGHQTIQNFSALSYTDYKVGLTKPLGSFIFGVAYTMTNATDNNLYHVINNGDNRNLRGNIFALSISRSM